MPPTFHLGSLILLASLFLWTVSPFPIQQQQQPCDYSQGNWIIDHHHHHHHSTLYDPSKDCPFIGQGFDCLKNGRTDKDYLNYRWKPSSCNLPRFSLFHSTFVFFKWVFSIHSLRDLSVAKMKTFYFC